MKMNETSPMINDIPRPEAELGWVAAAAAVVLVGEALFTVAAGALVAEFAGAEEAVPPAETVACEVSRLAYHPGWPPRSPYGKDQDIHS